MTTPNPPPTTPTTPHQQSSTEPPTKTTSNNDHLVVRWKNNDTISTSIANWIPPDNDTSPSASARPTKKLSKGLLHAQDILGKCNDPTETGTTKPINLDRPRNAPSEYLKHRQTPQDSCEFDGIHWTMTTRTTTATAPTATMTDPKAKENGKVFPSPHDAYPYASAKTPREELLFNYTHPTLKWTETQTSSPQMADMSTPQWQSTIATPGHPSPQMNVMTTPEWHTTTPTLATQSLPIATLPIPKWTHPPSSHLANNDIWPTNLIDIIRAIKKMPP